MTFVQAMFGIMALLIFALIFIIYMGYRNEAIYQFRTKMLKDAYARYEKEHDPGPITWALRASETVPYNTMMYRFWVWPLDRFFRDVK